MNVHIDTLDRPEPLGRFLVGSLAFHLLIATGIIAFNLTLGSHSRTQFGDPHGGKFGAVVVTAVSKLPIPARSGPVNPVASDTESRVPEPPAKPKPKPQVKAPEPDAIPLKSRNALKKPSEAASEPNKFRAMQKDQPNQLYAAHQAAVSPMFGVVGAGGVGIGNNSPFGVEFGWYANLVRDKVAQNWHTADVDPRIQSAPQVVVTFTIERDGSVRPGSVRVEQRSGIFALDSSTQRAVLDSAPFPPLPTQFARNSADVEFVFELRR
jgi:periplasmic protein TonB